MSIDIAQQGLLTKLGEVFNMTVSIENYDIKGKDNVCRLYVLVLGVRTITKDLQTYRYYFDGVVMLPLASPCMKPIGYLLDRSNFAIANNLMGGLGLSKIEERVQNKIQMRFAYLTDPIEYNPESATISNVSDPLVEVNHEA